MLISNLIKLVNTGKSRKRKLFIHSTNIYSLPFTEILVGAWELLITKPDKKVYILVGYRQVIVLNE